MRMSMNDSDEGAKNNDRDGGVDDEQNKLMRIDMEDKAHEG